MSRRRVVELVDWGRSPGAAAAAPHVLNRNGPTLIEAGTARCDLRAALEALGHEVEEQRSDERPQHRAIRRTA